jgi:hypothetical protein
VKISEEPVVCGRNACPRSASKMSLAVRQGILENSLALVSRRTGGQNKAHHGRERPLTTATRRMRTPAPELAHGAGGRVGVPLNAASSASTRDVDSPTRGTPNTSVIRPRAGTVAGVGQPSASPSYHSSRGRKSVMRACLGSASRASHTSEGARIEPLARVRRRSSSFSAQA